MIACVINGLLIVMGSLIGLAFGKKISQKICGTLISGLSVCVLIIGIIYAITTSDVIMVIISVVVGSVIGELIDIEKRVDSLGERLKASVMCGRENARFTEGFVTATLLFCVGSMAIVGSIEAGINHNYSIIISKSIIDCVIAVTFAAAMGVGVCFSALSVTVYQGVITLLAIVLGSFIPDAVISEVTAVGGVLLICVGVNTLGILNEGRIRVANMLPAMFVPIIYMSVASWIAERF